MQNFPFFTCFSLQVFFYQNNSYSGDVQSLCPSKIILIDMNNANSTTIEFRKIQKACKFDTNKNVKDCATYICKLFRYENSFVW